MDLLIEIGNTNLKYIFIENNKYINKNQLFINNNLSNLLPINKALSKVYVANVNDEMHLKETVDFYRNHGLAVHHVNQKIHPEVTNQYDNPDQLGIDRWLHVVVSGERK